MNKKFDCKRPHEWAGQNEENADFLRQDGLIYAWSESNYRYELAWWLNCSEDKASNIAKSIRHKKPGPSEFQWQFSQGDKF